GGVAGISGDCEGPEGGGEVGDCDGARDCGARRSGEEVTSEVRRRREKPSAARAASCQEAFCVEPCAEFCEACGGKAPAFVSHAVRGGRRCGSSRCLAR